MGGHVERCADCGHQRMAYNSCRNRHCPKCQALTRAAWLEREASYLLPVEYHHVVFTLPPPLAELARTKRRGPQRIGDLMIPLLIRLGVSIEEKHQAVESNTSEARSSD